MASIMLVGWRIVDDEPVQIVELSPEASALLRHQYDLDRAEAGPKLPIDSLLYRGVTPDCRWSVAAEFETMKTTVDTLPDLVRVRVESVWCDSRAQVYYTITIAERHWAWGIEWDFRDGVLAASHDFNGLSIEGDGRHADFDPKWSGDDYDYTEAEG
jgi:hypothetical protein